MSGGLRLTGCTSSVGAPAMVFLFIAFSAMLPTLACRRRVREFTVGFLDCHTLRYVTVRLGWLWRVCVFAVVLPWRTAPYVRACVPLCALCTCVAIHAWSGGTW